MKDSHRPNAPFKTLGTHLRYIREQSNETVAEVSGAVEIDEQMLVRIEDGFERPAEDIMLLLISHFAMQDQEALQLWELAGYDGSPDLRPPEEAAHTAQKAVVVMLAQDTRTMYSDGMTVDINQAGLTLSFTQASGDNKATTISRIGMSHAQAQAVINAMEKALLAAKYARGPKRLPPGDAPS